jgi:phospholipase C
VRRDARSAAQRPSAVAPRRRSVIFARMRKFAPVAAALTIVAAVGCANTSGNTAVSCNGVSAQDAKPSHDWQGTVFTIVMENKGKKDIMGNSSAPFINSLAQQNAVAAGYHDSYVHPSEPNYLEMVAGENFGVLDDDEPSSHHIDAKAHIADQLELQGMTWKAYEESMGAPCGLTGQYPYEPKHNPFVFFNDINGWDGKQFNPATRCNQHVVDYSQLDADLAAGTLPKYVFITPNMISDMHDGSVADGDAWLSREVPKILGSKAFNNGGVLFLLWDEGGGYPQGDDPPMIVISPHAKRGFVSQTPYDTSSYLKTAQKILGLQSLPCNPKSDSVQSMDELFDVPLDAEKTTPATPTTPTTTPGTPAPGTPTTPTTPTPTAPGTPTALTAPVTPATAATAAGPTPAPATGQ